MKEKISSSLAHIPVQPKSLFKEVPNYEALLESFTIGHTIKELLEKNFAQRKDKFTEKINNQKARNVISLALKFRNKLHLQESLNYIVPSEELWKHIQNELAQINSLHELEPFIQKHFSRARDMKGITFLASLLLPSSVLLKDWHEFYNNPVYTLLLYVLSFAVSHKFTHINFPELFFLQKENAALRKYFKQNIYEVAALVEEKKQDPELYLKFLDQKLRSTVQESAQEIMQEVTHLEAKLLDLQLEFKTLTTEEAKNALKKVIEETDAQITEWKVHYENVKELFKYLGTQIHTLQTELKGQEVTANEMEKIAPLIHNTVESISNSSIKLTGQKILFGGLIKTIHEGIENRLLQLSSIKELPRLTATQSIEEDLLMLEAIKEIDELTKKKKFSHGNKAHEKNIEE